MSADDDFLPISLISHTQFCARRAWLELNGEESDTSQMQAGHSAHRNVDDPKTSRKQRKTGVIVRSEKHRINGRVDEIQLFEDNSVSLIEYKATPVRRTASVTPAHRLQLTLQRLCLEDEGYDVVDQGIYFTDHRRHVPVELDELDFRTALAKIAETREIANSASSPPVLEDQEQCSRCSHFSLCLPDEHQLKQVKRRIHVSDPDGQVLHLSTQGSRASTRSGRVVVTRHGEKIGDVPMERVAGLIVHGNIDLSSALHRNLLWNNVPVVWCSSTGRVYGFSRPADGPNGLLRVRQHVLSERGDLDTAKSMVRAKILNQATLLGRNSDAKSVASTMRDHAHAIATATSIPELFGIEGEAASLYFSSFARMLRDVRLEKLGWTWSGRIGRGASDPINILLNYAYGLLRAEAIRAILACGLDPHAGFFHSSNRNKPALALDLMEEFRAPVADSVVISLINRHEIASSDFSKVGDGARLRDSGRKKLISAFERRIQTSLRHPIFGYEVTWRRAIEVQARMLLAVLDGSLPSYQGIRIR